MLDTGQPDGEGAERGRQVPRKMLEQGCGLAWRPSPRQLAWKRGQTGRLSPSPRALQHLFSFLRSSESFQAGRRSSRWHG